MTKTKMLSSVLWLMLLCTTITAIEADKAEEDRLWRTQLMAKVDAILDRLDAMEAKSKEVEGRVDKIEKETLPAINSRLSDLEAKEKTTETRLSEFATKDDIAQMLAQSAVLSAPKENPTTKDETKPQEESEMKIKETKSNVRNGKEIDWEFAAKLASEIQGATAKKQRETAIKFAEAYIKALTEANTAYISIDNQMQIEVGVANRIVGDTKYSFNVLKPFKRTVKDKTLDMSILGLGMIYTGKNEELEAVALDGYDYRYANSEGGEVFAMNGKIVLRKEISPHPTALRNFYNIRKKADSVNKKAFVHLNADEVDLKHHAGEHKMKVIVADHDGDRLLVRTVIEHDGQQWTVIYGKLSDCVTCNTVELRNYLLK